MVEDGRIERPAWAVRHPVLWTRLGYLGLVTQGTLAASSAAMARPTGWHPVGLCAAPAPEGEPRQPRSGADVCRRPRCPRVATACSSETPSCREVDSSSPRLWPPPPDGWSPPTGWEPDPSWPSPPEGWLWWQRQRRTGWQRCGRDRGDGRRTAAVGWQPRRRGRSTARQTFEDPLGPDLGLDFAQRGCQPFEVVRCRARHDVDIDGTADRPAQLGCVATHDDVLHPVALQDLQQRGGVQRLARLAAHGLAVADRRASARTWLVCSNAAACCACCSGVRTFRRASRTSSWSS